jgi:hypothetical protein
MEKSLGRDSRDSGAKVFHQIEVGKVLVGCTLTYQAIASWLYALPEDGQPVPRRDRHPKGRD